MPLLDSIALDDLRDAWVNLAAHGTPPAAEIAGRVLPAWTVNLDAWLDRLTRLYLRDHCLRNSHFKLALAPNGGGKTHFLLALAARAAEEGWAVSLLQCKNDAPLADWFKLYDQAVSAIQLPGVSRRGMKPIAQAALATMQQRAEQAPDSEAALDEMIAAVGDEDWPHHSFGCVMTTLLRHLRDPRANAELGEAALRWLEGQPDRLTAAERRALHLQNVGAGARQEHGRTLFYSLLKFLPSTGAHGLTLLFDEMETILNARGRGLERILIIMRTMLDAPDSRMDRIPLFGIFAVVPEIVPRIRQHYPALDQRFKVMIPFHDGDDNAPQLDLSKLGAQREMLQAIGKKLLALGTKAYGWRFDLDRQHSNLDRLAAVTSERMLETDARRLFVKTWCSLLGEQGRGGEVEYPEAVLTDRVQGVYEEIRRDDAATTDEVG